MRRERPLIGVLAMQGAFAAHVAMLTACGARAIEVRRASELERCDGLVVPGGESTAIRKALVRGGMYESLRARIASGVPVLGTCAGLIVLAHAPQDGAPACLGLLDVDVDRNGFGRQMHSFEAVLDTGGGEQARLGVFIRAPRITRVGDDVEVVALLGDEPVAVRAGHLVGATFHPELTDDPWLHEDLVARVRSSPR